MTERLTHSVDSEDCDLEMAVALGIEVVASCGETFRPFYLGRDAEAFSFCPKCYPQRGRAQGSRRMTTMQRSRLPHFVYRCYDKRDRLLYVGCTYNPPARMRQHRAEKRGWIHAVARTRLIVWPDRSKALEMERLAIETEAPIYNKAFNRRSA